jgi:hypothetical protein
MQWGWWVGTGIFALNVVIQLILYRKTRKKLCLLCALLFFVLTAFYAVQASSLFRDPQERVHAGMTVAEVEALLGPGAVCEGPRGMVDFSADQLGAVPKGAAMTWKEWRKPEGDENRLYVGFVEGKAVLVGRGREAGR